MRDRRLLACPHGRNIHKINTKWFRVIFEVERRSDVDFLITWVKTQGCVQRLGGDRNYSTVSGTSARHQHRRSPPYFLLACGSVVVRAEPWAARWVPKTRLPRRDPKWLTRTSERTERRRPERWSCCSWVGHVWRFKTLNNHGGAALVNLKCWCLKFSLQSEQQRRWWPDCIRLNLARICDSTRSVSHNCGLLAGFSLHYTKNKQKHKQGSTSLSAAVSNTFWSWKNSPSVPHTLSLVTTVPVLLSKTSWLSLQLCSSSLKKTQNTTRVI